jgi:hypothetical protein
MLVGHVTGHRPLHVLLCRYTPCHLPTLKKKRFFNVVFYVEQQQTDGKYR